MGNTLIVQWLRVLTSVLALLLISQSVAGQNEIRDQSRHSTWAELSTEAAKPASVTIVEYSDFQCPYCKRAASVVSQIKQAYGDSVKITFKQMPLPFHQHAFKAAQASVCSAQQGKFWEFHDRVFASTDLSVDALKQIASEAGLKVGEFNACLESEASRAVVEQELEEARQLGVTGTPTFIMNGRKVVGAISFDVFKREIDREIMRAQNPTPNDPPAKSIDPAIEILNRDYALVDAKNAGVQRAVRGVVTAGNQPLQETATLTSTGVNLSLGSVAFGYQLVGTTSNQIVETVTNLSNTLLIITDISVSGRDRRDFATSYNFRLPVTVAPGNSIAVNLTFTPALPWRPGTRNARLEIAEKQDSQYVALTGIGATCGGPLPACSSGCPDADGDGLNDAWEIAGGIDVNNDGVVDPTHDLLLHGADLNKPDIFVQYDWMDYGLNDIPCATDSECTSQPGLGHAGETCTGPATPYSTRSCVHACVVDSDCTGLGPSHVGDRCDQNSCEHTHDPEVLSPGALQAVIDAFAAHGFNLHILRGRALPHSHVVSFRTPEANCEGANVSPGTLGAYAVNLYDLKNVGFDPRRTAAFHYSVFGHLSSCDNDGHCDTPTTTGTCPAVKGSRPQLGQTGQAEISGNDFTVSLGHFVSDLGGAPRRTILAGTFMHELGHNFGLHHAGGTSASGTLCVAPDCEDAPQFKPNYLSVMNYRYQTTGILEGDAVGSSSFRSCSTDADCSTSSGARCEHFGFGGICLRIDYSSSVLPTGGNTPRALTENGQLNEPAGLGSGTSDLFSFDDGQCSFVPFAATHGPVNWDGVGLPDNPNARSDLNTQDHLLAACTVTNQTLRGHTDWGPALGQSIFTMAFQCTSNGLDDRASLSEGLADRRVVDSGQISQGELSPEMAAAAHLLYPPRPVRLQIDPEPPLTRQSKSRPSTRTVTLLGTEDLDVTEIDQTSLRVGGLVPLGVSVRDVDGDGRADLIVEFDAIQLTLRANAEKIRVTGWLKNSQVFVGDVESNSKRVSGSEIAAPGTIANAPSHDGHAQDKQPEQVAATVTATGVTLSPGSVNFGYQLVGTTSNQVVETVINSGTATVIITDISVSGRDRRDFIPTYSFTLPVTVAPGGSITINLTFTPLLPWRAGTRNARLEIAETKNSQYVSLTGIGATCGGPVPACSSGCADTDGDGLNDAWEIEDGIDFDNDGLVDFRFPHADFTAVAQAGDDTGMVLPGRTNPKNAVTAYNIVVSILTSGQVGAATFSYTLGGGTPVGPLLTARAVDIPGNIRLGFANGPVSPSFVAGATYSFSSGDFKVADKNKPNIYVQYDYMDWTTTPSHACTADADCVGGGGELFGERCHLGYCNHNHDPDAAAPGAISKVVAAYAAQGITLYIDPVHQALPHSNVVSWRTPEAACEGVDVAPGVLGTYAVNYFDLKKFSSDNIAVGFDDKRKLVYHYGIFSHYSGCDFDALGTHCNQCPNEGTPGRSGHPSPGQSGMAEIPGNDFIVSLGAYSNDQNHPPNLFNVGGTFMHELGHNFGLRHAGDGDTPGYKPNYLSVMNYNFQFTGIAATDAPPADPVAGVQPSELNRAKTRLDYSRSTVKTLDEVFDGVRHFGLDEQSGMACGAPDALSVFQYTNDNGDSALGSCTGPVNWDIDGNVTGRNLQVDLNQPDHPGVVVHTQLTGHTDWGPSFIAAMPFQCSEWGSADGAVSLEHVTTGELTPEMAARHHVLYQPKSIRVQSDTEPPIELQTKAHPFTRAVTILGSEDLDVSEIDQTSLRVAGLPPLSVSMRDVDGDGSPDLVVKFDMSKLPLARAGSVRVTGWLKNSQVFAGDATAISQKSR